MRRPAVLVQATYYMLYTNCQSATSPWRQRQSASNSLKLFSSFFFLFLFFVGRKNAISHEINKNKKQLEIKDSQLKNNATFKFK